MWEMLIILAIFVAVMYFLMIRPAKKQADAQKQTMATLAPGVRVLMQSGMIGTVRAVGDRQLVVELAPGADVTVLKQVVVKILNPEDEEFEYSDPELEAADEPLALEAGDGLIDADSTETTETTETTSTDSVSLDDYLDSLHDKTPESTDAEETPESTDADAKTEPKN
jgi:preprotein translocase subunit YajC